MAVGTQLVTPPLITEMGGHICNKSEVLTCSCPPSIIYNELFVRVSPQQLNLLQSGLLKLPKAAGQNLWQRAEGLECIVKAKLWLGGNLRARYNS